MMPPGPTGRFVVLEDRMLDTLTFQAWRPQETDDDSSFTTIVAVILTPRIVGPPDMPGMGSLPMGPV